nr:rod shape-determining protein MreC [uncultured bacterium]
MKSARSTKLKHDKYTVLMAGVLAAVAVGLFALPVEATARLRTLVRDATLPGNRAIVVLQKKGQELLAQYHSSSVADAEVTKLREELEEQQLENRRLKLETAAANERLAAAKRDGASPYAAVKSSPLVVPELIEANVMGDEAAGAFRNSQLIDRGNTSGVAESDLILRSTAPVIDQGRDAGLAADQPIYAGRTVIGKVRDAGRWTSTIERVTDVEYRGHAQLTWQSAQGPVFGAEGILEGRGDGTCRLTNVAATAAVNVGDEVYTAKKSGALPEPMYYGKVVQADLPSGALFWDIVVKPEAEQLSLQTVQVLTTRRNPQRPLAN